MVDKTKLKALQRTYDVEEQHAADDLRSIEGIVNQRREALECLESKCFALQETLISLRTNARIDAAQLGDSVQLSSIQGYAKKLEREITLVSESIREKSQELFRAEERAGLAEEELLAVRLAKRRVEKYQEKRRLKEKLVDEAREEAQTDEMSFFNKRKS